MPAVPDVSTTRVKWSKNKEHVLGEMMLKINANTSRGVTTACRLLAILLVVGIVSLIVVQPALACPTCKEAISENGQSQEGLVRGYFWSIIFMMSMPFLIFGGLGYYFGWQVRKARAAQLLETAGEAVVEAAVIDPDASTSRVTVEPPSVADNSVDHQTLLHP